jgi:hypothetical protein
LNKRVGKLVFIHRKARRKERRKVIVKSDVSEVIPLLDVAELVCVVAPTLPLAGKYLAPNGKIKARGRSDS